MPELKPFVVAPLKMQRRLVIEKLGLNLGQYVEITNAEQLRGQPPDRKIYRAIDRYNRSLTLSPDRNWMETKRELRLFFTNVELVEI